MIFSDCINLLPTTGLYNSKKYIVLILTLVFSLEKMCLINNHKKRNIAIFNVIKHCSRFTWTSKELHLVFAT